VGGGGCEVGALRGDVRAAGERGTHDEEGGSTSLDDDHWDARFRVRRGWYLLPRPVVSRVPGRPSEYKS